VALSCSTAVIDGEVIVQDECGVSDFPALRRAMAREPHRLGFFAFDILHLNGADLRAQPLVERRALLRDLLGANDPTCSIQFSEAFAGKWAAIFALADRMGLEGVVSKRADSKYRSGSSKAWLKTKCMTEGEFFVIGTERNPGGPPFALVARAQPAMRSGCGRKSSLR
jgi:ATP-dependent DNA ligase